VSTQEYDDSDLESERDAIVLQASTDEELAGEVITPGGEVTLAGRSFRVAEKVGLMPLLKFSHASSLKTTDERAYVALYQILKDIIRAADPPCGRCNGCKTAGRDPRSRDCTHADQGDWEEFEEWAVESKADADELLDVVTEAIKVISARPTESRSVSSGGSREVSRRSTASRSGRQAGGSGSSRQGRRAT
jgi:hypothetical protein